MSFLDDLFGGSTGNQFLDIEGYNQAARDKKSTLEGRSRVGEQAEEKNLPWIGMSNLGEGNNKKNADAYFGGGNNKQNADFLDFTIGSMGKHDFGDERLNKVMESADPEQRRFLWDKLKDLNPQERIRTIESLEQRLQEDGWWNRAGDWFMGNDDYHLRKFFEDNPGFKEVFRTLSRENLPADQQKKKDQESNLQQELLDLFSKNLQEQERSKDDLQKDYQRYQDDSRKASEDILKEYEGFKKDYKDRLGLGDSYLDRQIEQAEDYRKAPSVVDDALRSAFMQQKGQLANAFAGRRGGGYLEDFNNQASLANQQIRDTGTTQRLQEDLSRQQYLSNVLGGASQQQYANANSTPFGLLSHFQNARQLPISSQHDMLNFLTGDRADQRNWLNQLFAWKSGEQNYGSRENQRWLDNQNKDRILGNQDTDRRREYKRQQEESAQKKFDRWEDKITKYGKKAGSLGFL